MIIAIISPSLCPHSLPYIKVFSVLSAFFQRWWNGFHQLTICLNHNVASFVTMPPHYKLFYFLLNHANPYYCVSDPFKFSINVFFFVILCCQFTWVVILLVWCLNAWCEWSVPWVIIMLLQYHWERWHRDFALWTHNSEWHILALAHYTWRQW